MTRMSAEQGTHPMVSKNQFLQDMLGILFPVSCMDSRRVSKLPDDVVEVVEKLLFIVLASIFAATVRTHLSPP